MCVCVIGAGVLYQNGTFNFEIHKFMILKENNNGIVLIF